MASFIFKILVLSGLISVAIKYGGPLLPVSGNTATVLIAVLSPTILMAIALGWRWQQTRSEE